MWWESCNYTRVHKDYEMKMSGPFAFKNPYWNQNCQGENCFYEKEMGAMLSILQIRCPLAVHPSFSGIASRKKGAWTLDTAFMEGWNWPTEKSMSHTALGRHCSTTYRTFTFSVNLYKRFILNHTESPNRKSKPCFLTHFLKKKIFWGCRITRLLQFSICAVDSVLVDKDGQKKLVLFIGLGHCEAKIMTGLKYCWNIWWQIFHSIGVSFCGKLFSLRG